MFQTIQVSSCVSVQGELVQALADGQVVIRVGEREYRGRPIGRGAGPGVMPLDVVAALEAAPHRR